MTSSENSTPAASEESERAPTDTSSTASPALSGIRPLRWWPAVILLALMAAMKIIPSMMEQPAPMPIMMIGFMGPAAVSLVMLAWWCFASRAPAREKGIGIAGFLVIAGLGTVLLHFTLKGMWVPLFIVPAATAGFTLGTVLFARSEKYRVGAALALSAAVFSYWNVHKSEGVTGNFTTELLWRWEPTPEDTYLAMLESSDLSSTAGAIDEPVDAASAEWPSFRGADRNSVVENIALDPDWSANPPKEIWRRRIGPGWGSFSVAGNRMFTQEQRGDQEVIVCLDTRTGDTIWEYSYDSRFWESIAGAGPRATPTIAEEGLLSLGAEGILTCLDPETGSEIWKRDLRDDADRQPPTWGFSASPLVAESVAIVHAGGEDDRGLLAYNVEDGTIAWSIPAGDHSYSSPQLATFDGVTGALMLCNDGLQFVNIADGEIIWKYDWPFTNYRTLQPLVMGNTVIITTSLGEGTRRLNVEHADGGDWQITEEWTSNAMKSDYNDYVAHDGYLYGFDGSILACVNLQTGDREWKRGRYGNGQVLLLAESGQLILVSEKGELVLINATPEKLDEVARFQAIEGKTWNHLVLIKDRLYLRNSNEAACYQMPVRGASAADVAALNVPAR